MSLSLNYCIYPKISVGIYIQGGVYVIKFELLYIPKNMSVLSSRGMYGNEC